MDVGDFLKRSIRRSASGTGAEVGMPEMKFVPPDFSSHTHQTTLGLQTTIYKGKVA